MIQLWKWWTKFCVEVQKSIAMEAEYRSVRNEPNTGYNVEEQSFEIIIAMLLYCIVFITHSSTSIQG
jgi:hypothetical protein